MCGRVNLNNKAIKTLSLSSSCYTLTIATQHNTSLACGAATIRFSTPGLTATVTPSLPLPLPLPLPPPSGARAVATPAPAPSGSKLRTAATTPAARACLSHASRRPRGPWGAGNSTTDSSRWTPRTVPRGPLWTSCLHLLARAPPSPGGTWSGAGTTPPLTGRG